MHREYVIAESDLQKNPKIIQLENARKRGVDTVEEMASSYSTAQKTNRLPIVTFYSI